MYELGEDYIEAMRPQGVQTKTVEKSNYIVCECSRNGDREPINIITKPIWTGNAKISYENDGKKMKIDKATLRMFLFYKFGEIPEQKLNDMYDCLNELLETKTDRELLQITIIQEYLNYYSNQEEEVLLANYLPVTTARCTELK